MSPNRKIAGNSYPFINYKASSALLAAMLSAGLAGTARADFLQTGGTWDFGNTSYWAAGTIDGTWNSTLTLNAAQNITFGADTSVTNLTFNNGGNFAINLRSADTTARTLTLNGNITVNTSGGTSANVLIGNTTNPLNISLAAGNRSLDVAANRTLTLSNVVSGSGTIQKNGSGTLNLTGANTFSGGVVVNGGTLNIGVSSANSGTTLVSGATGVGNVTLNNNTNLTSSSAISWFVPTLSLNGTVNHTSNNRLQISFLNLELNNSSRTLNLNGGLKSVTGGNTLALGENTGQWLWETNSVLGTPTVRNGTLNLQSTTANSTSMGMFLMRSTNFVNADVVVGPNIVFGFAGNLGNSTNTANLTIQSGGIANLTNASRTIGLLAGGGTVFNTMVATGTANTTLTLQGASGSQDFSGVLSNGPAGTLFLTKSASGSTQILSGANTYTGNTTVNGGTLQIGNGGATGSLSPNSNISVGSGAVLAFSRNNTITQGTDFASSISGAGGVTQSGSGTLVLSGNNTYTGATTISAGTLQIGDGGITGALSTSSSINNTGTLVFNRSNTVVQGTDFAGTIAGTGGSVVQNGSGALTLSGSNSFTGGVTLNSGILNINNANALGTTAGTFVINGGSIDNTTGSAITTSAYPLSINAGFAFVGTKDLNLGAGAASLGAASGASRTITTTAGTLTLGGVISNGATANSLVKAGSGTLLLSGANSFTGGVDVQAGTLQIGSSSNFTANTGAIGAPSSGNLTLANGVTLQAATGYSVAASNINLLGNVTVGNSAATGRLSFTGTWDLGGASRTITLGKSSGATPYSAGSEVMQFEQLSGGNSAVIQNAGSGGSLKFASAAGATAAQPSVVAINSSAASFASNLGLELGDGVALKSRTGNFFASGVNAPALTLAADAGKGGGVLQMGDGISGGNAVMRGAIVYSLAGGGTITASNTSGNTTTGTLTINNGNGADFFGTITNGGGTGVIALTKSGSGTQILSGNNTYTGNTTVSGGKLLVNGSIGSSLVNVTTGATLGGNGTINGATTIGAGATLSPGNSPGVLTFASGLSLNSTSSTLMELNGLTRGAEYDGINITGGSLSYGGNMTVSFGSAFISGNTTFDLFSFSGSPSGAFSSIASTALYEFTLNNSNGYSALDQLGNTWSFDHTTGDLSFAAVPEPSAFAVLAGLAGLGVAGLRRRRRA